MLKIKPEISFNLKTLIEFEYKKNVSFKFLGIITALMSHFRWDSKVLTHPIEMSYMFCVIRFFSFSFKFHEIKKNSTLY